MRKLKLLVIISLLPWGLLCVAVGAFYGNIRDTIILCLILVLCYLLLWRGTRIGKDIE